MHTDYVMRQVSLFAEMLVRILGLRRRREYAAAVDAIGNTLDMLLRLPPDALSTFSAAELFQRLTFVETAAVGREKCIFVAALLKEAGDVYVEQEKLEEAAQFYLKALQLRLELQLSLPDEGGSHAPYTPDVTELLAKFDLTTLPLDTYSLLMLYYEQIGAFSKAEDVLFEMRDAAADPVTLAEVVDMGSAFYRRLQQQSDAALSAGNLSRDEVQAGLRELKTGGG